MIKIKKSVKSSNKRLLNVRKKRPRKKFSHPNTEHSLQKSFFDYLNKNHPALRPICFSVPNEAAKTLGEGIVLKQRGLTKGVPDCFCAIPNSTFHGLFIEFKKGRNLLSEAQKEKIRQFEAQGYACHVCYTLDEAIFCFERHLGG